MLRSLVVVLVVCTPTVVRADGWVTAEAPASFAASAVQQGVFRPGVMPAVGVYASSERAAIGVRLRAGVLRDGPAPDDPFRDPGTGGLLSGGLALRLPLPAGAWVEGVGGAGITGSDAAPVVELGVGWLTTVGAFDVGPSARVIHVVARQDMDTLGSATLATVGVDIRIGRTRMARPRPTVERIEVAPVRVETMEPEEILVAASERDHDRVVDQDDSCRVALVGCFRHEGMTIEDDRIILEEYVLFDTSRARVRHAGQTAILRFVQEWQRHPEWKTVRIEGHADVRGPDAFNQWLSEERASRVKVVLEHAGIPEEHIEAMGFGRTRPRVTGTTDADHQSNRRVEFVIERGSR